MHWAAAKLPRIVIAFWLLPLLFEVGIGSSVNVNSETEFELALRDSSVQEVVLEQDLLLTSEQWAGNSRAAPYLLNRNLTITSSPRLRKLDFNYVGDGQVQLAPGIVLNISYTLLENARYGAGVQLDFLANSPGSYVALWHSVMVKAACVSSNGEPDAVAVQPRLPGFPGRQQAAYQDSFCVRKTCYDHVLVYEDYTKVTGTSVEDTAAGGYAIIMRNFSKICLTHLDDSCASAAWTIDDCIRSALDRLSPTLTPGQIQANAAAMQQRVTALTAGLAAGLGGGVLLLLSAVFLTAYCRRRRHQRRQLENEVKMLTHCCNAMHCSQDPELGMSGASGGSVPLSNKDVACVVAGHIAKGVQAASSTPPGTHNSWELAAWKTSERFLHQQQQQSLQPHSGADVVQCASSPAAGAGWYQRSNTASGSTADLIAGTNCTGVDGKVTLGVLLGAGSFGRVYKGRWRNMDVAVKVLQHSRAAAPSVANEVDLMMSFAHPHVVCAHHFVTWKRRSAKELTGCADLDLSLDERMQSVDLTAVWPGDAAASGAMSADMTGPHGELPEDTQTWIVQEFCDAGSLSEYCLGPAGAERVPGQLPEGHAMLKLLFRLREVADGMSYLHKRDVVHGDLKSGNVLLCVSAASPYGRVAKVTDFGLSRALGNGETHRSTHTLGTVSHMAPELLRFGKMSPAVDVFSFGIMMWELLTARVAFKGLHYGAIIEQVALLGARPPRPDDAAEDFCLLMSSCWNADPQQRPAFDQVMRCLDIMISCRQQELVEAKSGSSLAAQTHSGSGFAGGPLASHQHVGTSSGEFALTITTRAGSSRLGAGQQASQQQHGSQQSLQLHRSQSLTLQTSQSLAQHTTQSSAAQSSQSNATLPPQQQQQQQQGESHGSRRRSRLASGASRLGSVALDDALSESPFGPQDL